MSRREHASHALFILAVLLTASALLAHRPQVEAVTLALLTVAVAVWSLTETLRATARRHEQVQVSLRQVDRYGGGHQLAAHSQRPPTSAQPPGPPPRSRPAPVVVLPRRAHRRPSALPDYSPRSES